MSIEIAIFIGVHTILVGVWIGLLERKVVAMSKRLEEAAQDARTTRQYLEPRRMPFV